MAIKVSSGTLNLSLWGERIYPGVLDDTAGATISSVATVVSAAVSKNGLSKE